MAYEEKVGHVIEVLEDGVVQVKRVTRVLKDGVEIAQQYHRHVLEPGADTTAQVDKVKAVSAAVWTKDVVDEYKKKQSNGKDN
jgi:predicted SnoaL-like aldol condensation-catalyzing enzyme